MPNFTYSDNGLGLTKKFEGLRLSAYADQVGVWTIGYGHTGQGVHAGLTITQDQADAFLESDVAGSVACVNRLVTSEINQNQFDALVDFVFNLGCASLASSTLLAVCEQRGFCRCGRAVPTLGPCRRSGGPRSATTPPGRSYIVYDLMSAHLSRARDSSSRLASSRGSGA